RVPKRGGPVVAVVAGGNGREGGGAWVDAPAEGPLGGSFDPPPLLGGQDDRFHGAGCGSGEGPCRLPSLRRVNAREGSARRRRGCRGVQVRRRGRQRASGEGRRGQTPAAARRRRGR